MKNLRALLCAFWASHVQKTFASLLAGSAVFDLADAFLHFGGSLAEVIGPHLYHTLRTICASIILARAVIRPRSQQEGK